MPALVSMRCAISPTDHISLALWSTCIGLPGLWARSSGAMYHRVPMTVDSISADPWTRLLMPKSLSFTHQSPRGGFALIKTFCIHLPVLIRDTLQREGRKVRGTYSWFDITVGKPLAVHVAQPFQHLMDNDADIRFIHRSNLDHKLLEVTKGEVLHGYKDVIVGIVPS